MPSAGWGIIYSAHSSVDISSWKAKLVVTIPIFWMKGLMTYGLDYRGIQF